MTALVERLLRIPSEPHAPAGDPGSVRVFRAASGFYRFLVLKWIVKHLFAAAGLGVGLVVLVAVPAFPGKTVLDVLEFLGIAAYVLSLPFTYLMVHLDYQLRWYIVTDRSLRIREGLLAISEKTMSFANIQNISIQQGPIQRVLGIADVKVQTAGGGSGTPGEGGHARNMHLGYFHGVDNAEEIRDAILLRVRQLRDTGLGDPDAAAGTAGGPAGEDVLQAARELLGEARALRAALS
jgi:uncharacterized membrane protein YdbT with pleckstrin-like domain